MYVSFHKFRSLCTHQSLCSDVRILSAMFKSSVQVSRCRSLFTNVGLFSQMYVSFHKCRSLFTNVGLFFKCRSLCTNVDLLQVSRGVCMCICICIYVHMYRTLFAMFKSCLQAYRCVYVYAYVYVSMYMCARYVPCMCIWVLPALVLSRTAEQGHFPHICISFHVFWLLFAMRG